MVALQLSIIHSTHKKSNLSLLTLRVLLCKIYILKNEVVSVFLTLRYCIETVLKFTFQILLEFLAEYNYLTMNFVKNQPVKIGLLSRKSKNSKMAQKDNKI